MQDFCFKAEQCRKQHRHQAVKLVSIKQTSCNVFFMDKGVVLTFVRTAETDRKVREALHECEKEPMLSHSSIRARIVIH